MPIRLLILSRSFEACALWTSNERTCIAAGIAPKPIYLMPSQLVPDGLRDVHKNSLGHIRVRLRSGSPFVTLPFGLHFVLRFAIARGTMAEQKFQDVWKQQCVAARSVRAQHGILSALDYLIGEKLLIYAETAVTRPEFARELPRFVAEVREMFSGEEIGHYLNHLERMAAIEDEQIGNQDDDELFDDSPDQRAAKRARLAQLKELLTSPMLGTA
jgi:hypothetical protein